MPKHDKLILKFSGRKRRRLNSSDTDSESDCDEEKIQRADNNHLYFWCDVTKKTCLTLSMQLTSAFQKLRNLAYPGDEIPPLYIHINSYGGEVDAALGLIDHIFSLKQQGAKIITIIEGYAASAATMISIAGSERRIRPNAYMRIHQFRSGLWGKKKDLDDEHQNLEKLEKILLYLYKENTNMKSKQLKKLLNRELDLLPDECIQMGLVDNIQY